eukprot:SAG22_NODE_2300_length_2739_cov_2.636364_2_plen_302_part_00
MLARRTLAKYLECGSRADVAVKEVLDFFSQILQVSDAAVGHTHAIRLTIFLRTAAEHLLLLQGLEHVHNAGLVHRDLKPANIFLAKDDREDDREDDRSTQRQCIKIGDFGLSKENAADAGAGASGLSGSSSFERLPGGAGGGDASDGFDMSEQDAEGAVHTTEVGTTFYASPEQRAGKDISEQADIYSAGVILAELFSTFGTGSERCHTLRQIQDAAMAARREPDQSWGITQQYPVVLNQCMLMLQKEPGDRPEAAQVRQWVKDFQRRHAAAAELVKTNTAGSTKNDSSENPSVRERRGSV